MSNAYKVKQLQFKMPDRAGLLAEITTAIAEAGVNLEGICAYGMEGEAIFMLVTDNNDIARNSLAGLGIDVKEEDVTAIRMDNRPGELKGAADSLADADVNISYMYATVGTAESAVAILKTADEDRTIQIING